MKRKGGTGKGRGGRKGGRKREGEEEGRVRDVPPPPVSTPGSASGWVSYFLKVIYYNYSLLPLKSNLLQLLVTFPQSN